MNPEDLLRQASFQFLPPEKIKVSDWASRYYELPETSAEPGRWNSDRAPYQKGIMDAICEPGIQKISLMCAAQVGKTIILLAVICYLIDLDPCSILLTFPSSDAAEIFSKEKLSSAINKVKPVNQKIVEKSRNSNSTILMKIFAGGFLRLTGANSPSSLASMSIRTYLGDEIDKYPASAGKEGDPVKLATERTSTFWNWLVFLVSTPSIKGNSRIEQEFEASDKRRYFVPCPHCNHAQHLVWERIEYVGKGTPTADPLAGVYYICENCDRPISESNKRAMMSKGQWQSTAKADDPKHAGFHLNRLYSPWKSWVDLALDHQASLNDPQKMQVFVNATLGLPFENLAGDKLDWEKIRDRSLQANYAQGTIPEGVIILTAGVDVQADRLEIAVWGWGRGEQAWLISVSKIFGDPLSVETWEQLYHLTSKDFSHPWGVTLKIRATCIDSGYLTQEVYHQVKKFRHQHWFAVKGIQGDRPLIATPTIQEINYQGKKIKRGIKLYKVGVDTAKETLYSRSQITKPGDKYLNFPSDLPALWFAEFFSEVQVIQHVRGRPSKVWQKIPGVRNEALDISVYALAAAVLVGVKRINWEIEEAKLKEKILLTEPVPEVSASNKKTRVRSAKRKRG